MDPSTINNSNMSNAVRQHTQLFVSLSELDINKYELNIVNYIVNAYDNSTNEQFVIQELNFIIRECMPLNYIFTNLDAILDEYDDVNDLLHAFNSIYIPNMTLNLFLQLYIVSTMVSEMEYPKEQFLLNWLVEKGLEKNINIVYLASYNMAFNHFVEFYEIYDADGFCEENYEGYGISFVVSGGSMDIMSYLLGEDVINLYYLSNYDLQYAYEGNRYDMIRFLTSEMMQNRGFEVSNIYIVNSIRDNNYYMFEALYPNFPEVEVRDILFASEELNNRLTHFINQFENENELIEE